MARHAFRASLSLIPFSFFQNDGPATGKPQTNFADLSYAHLAIPVGSPLGKLNLKYFGLFMLLYSTHQPSRLTTRSQAASQAAAPCPSASCYRSPYAFSHELLHPPFWRLTSHFLILPYYFSFFTLLAKSYILEFFHLQILEINLFPLFDNEAY